jgi:hypothetical protein
VGNKNGSELERLHGASVSMFGDLERIFQMLPKNPVSPENRNVTRLLPSAVIPRGQVYRITLPEMFDDQLPRMAINPNDVIFLRAEFMNTPWARLKTIDVIDQEIADLCEECFAHRELCDGR